MVDEPIGILLGSLRRIDTKLDRNHDEVMDLKRRVTLLEGCRAHFEVSIDGTTRRFERLEVRPHRIERPH